jgi:hypothetical protein
MAHCEDPADEAGYDCSGDDSHDDHDSHDDGEVECHCDGTVAHCTDPAAESSIECLDETATEQAASAPESGASGIQLASFMVTFMVAALGYVVTKH